MKKAITTIKHAITAIIKKAITAMKNAITMKKAIIAIVCSLFLAPVVFAQELERWQGTIDEVSLQSKYLLVGDNPFVMDFSMAVKTHKGEALERFDLKQGQNVEIFYEVKRSAKQHAKEVIIYPNNHVFSNEDDE